MPLQTNWTTLATSVFLFVFSFCVWFCPRFFVVPNSGCVQDVWCLWDPLLSPPFSPTAPNFALFSLYRPPNSFFVSLRESSRGTVAAFQRRDAPEVRVWAVCGHLCETSKALGAAGDRTPETPKRTLWEVHGPGTVATIPREDPRGKTSATFWASHPVGLGPLFLLVVGVLAQSGPNLLGPN